MVEEARISEPSRTQKQGELQTRSILLKLLLQREEAKEYMDPKPGTCGQVTCSFNVHTKWEVSPKQPGPKEPPSNFPLLLDVIG